MSEFTCLSCGYAAQESEAAGTHNVAKCPKCGRDMYRSFATPAPNAPLAPVSGQAGGVRSGLAIPSRYGAALPSTFDASLPDEEAGNPVILPHTPFIVVLGFIFSLLPLICIAGLIISIMGLNLVNASPKGVRGKGLAIAGIVIGAAMTLITLVLLAGG